MPLAEHPSKIKRVKDNVEVTIRKWLDPRNTHSPIILPHNFLGEAIVAFRSDYEKYKAKQKDKKKKAVRVEETDISQAGDSSDIPLWDRSS